MGWLILVPFTPNATSRVRMLPREGLLRGRFVPSSQAHLLPASERESCCAEVDKRKTREGVRKS